MTAPALSVVVIGGPRHGQGLRVDATRLHHGVLMPDVDLAATWREPTQDDQDIQVSSYRWERYVLNAALDPINLLVLDSIPGRDLHRYLAVLLTPAAQAAMGENQ